MCFAALGVEDASYSMKIDRIGYQGIQRIRRDGDNTALLNKMGSSGHGLRTGLIGVNFDKICGHVNGYSSRWNALYQCARGTRS